MRPQFHLGRDGSIEAHVADTLRFRTLRDVETYLDEPQQVIGFDDLGRIAAVLAASSRPGPFISNAVHIDKLIDGHYLRFPNDEAELAFNRAAAKTASRIASLGGDPVAFRGYPLALNNAPA